MSETRKLAAILAADVVGYSRLAGSDEDRTLARLRALRSDLIDPTIAVHHGRVVKRTGDGALVEFRSVVDAVRCAIEVQNGMVERNAGVPPERRIEFRIGIHLGDVVEESDGDLMGDGVNIAARLEGIAEPNGICLSGAAYEQVRDKLKDEFVDLGDKELKNIARPVRAYRVSLSRNAARLEPIVSGRVRRKPGAARQAVDCRAAVPEHERRPGAGIFRRRHRRGHHHRAVEAALACSSSPAIRPSPTRASRQTSGRWRASSVSATCLKAACARRVSGCGSTASSSTRLAGDHVWAERYDRAVSDIFAVQDEITDSVVASIEPQLYAAENLRLQSKPPESLDAWGCVIRAMPYVWTWVPQNDDTGINLLKRAVELDPAYARASSLLAWAHAARAHLGKAEAAPELEIAAGFARGRPSWTPMIRGAISRRDMSTWCHGGFIRRRRLSARR